MHGVADTLAGAVGAVVSIYVGLPLDTITVRIQTKGHLFRSPIDCVSKTVRQEGLLAFWKGSLPALASGMVENTVVFGANGLLYATFVKKNETPTFRKQCILNGASAIFSGFAITPAECIKCRLQSSLGFQSAESRFISAIKLLYRTEGILGFYRGLGATLIRDVPFYMIFFGSYTTYKSYITNKYYNNNEKLIHPLHYILGGGLSGSLAWACVFPIDVIKSQQQTQIHRKSFYQTIQLTIEKYGFRKFYHGFTPCVIRGFPANGALFFAVELTKKIFNYFGWHSGNSLGSQVVYD